MRKLLYILIFLSFGSFGQEINHFSFNELYDFNVSTVFDINESSDHIMWFGTSEGLVSFDGVSFKKYVNDKYAIAYTNVKFDKRGRVWCSNFGGQLFYLENDSLKLALNWSENGQFITEYDVQDLPKIKIIGSNIGRIMEYDMNDSSLNRTLYKNNNAKILSMITSKGIKYAIHTFDEESRKGILSIYKNGFLPSDEYRKGTFDIDLPAGKWSLFGDESTLLINSIRNDGKIFSIKDDSIQLIIPEINLSTYSFNGVDFLNNRIWVLSKTGVSVYEKDGTPYLKNFLDGLSASSICEDHEGNIWISSLNRGIVIIPSISFRSLEISENSIAHSTTDEMGNIFAINDRGSLIKISPSYDRNSIIILSENELEPAPLYFDAERNRILLGSFQLYYDLTQNKLCNISAVDQQKKRRFKSVANIGDGYYISTYYSQAFIVSINNKNDPPLNLENNSGNIIRKNRSKHVGTPRSKNGAYIDFIDGLFYYDKVDTPRRVIWKGRDIQSAHIVEDPKEKDVVWIGTKSRELLKLSKGEVIESFSLPAVAHKIALNDEFIFLASQQGIFRLNRSSEEIEVIDETDGWIKGRITSLFLHNNHCVIVGNKHLQKIPIGFNTKNEVKPKLHLTEIMVEDKKLKLSRNLFFPSGSNFITFRFRGLSARSQKKLNYQYRLSNQSKKWITTSFDRPEARFLNLESGNYQFEVRVCNESGLCSDIEQVSFTIKSPYYRQWWFVLILFGGAASIIFAVIRLRYRNREREERLKSEHQRLRKETYKSKIAAIRSQMNPHFIFNALNTIQEFILTNQQDIASEYLADFADLMRMYLNQSKEDNVSLSEEEESLQLYLRLENLRFNGELNYKIEIDPVINKDGTYIPVMLLQPYIENSIKHGLLHKKGPKELRIRFDRISEGGIKCTIEDNGVGREASTKINAAKSIGHKSFATGANDSRIDLINKNRESEIKVDIIDLYQDGEPEGTRVEIVIRKKSR